jgi:hypothetical protein
MNSLATATTYHQDATCGRNGFRKERHLLIYPLIPADNVFNESARKAIVILFYRTWRDPRLCQESILPSRFLSSSQQKNRHFEVPQRPPPTWKDKENQKRYRGSGHEA